MARQWAVFVDGEGDPHLVIEENGKQRMATKAECERAMGLLNEEGSNVIRLWCRNAECKEGNKGWIERSRQDIEKNVYQCDLCGKAMTR